MKGKQRESTISLNKQRKHFQQKETEWKAEIEVCAHVRLQSVHVGLLSVHVGLLNVHVGLLSAAVRLLSVHVGLLSVHVRLFDLI